MTARQYEICPQHDELAQLLEPQSGLNPDLDQHLNDCAICRETLVSLAGAPRWWEQAQSALRAPSPDLDWASTICALSSTQSDGSQGDPLCEHELRQLQSLLEQASHPELIGRLGRYELEQLVGRGGMGLVFRARDVELRRVVAVKTLAVHLIPIGAARERFIREARASASLTHPHIVPVFDVITDGTVPAIVMQYVAGQTLEHRLFESGAMQWMDALRIGIQLSDALVAAHEQGLVHRDIKPGNVLLEAGDSRALLTDFGLVRTLDDATLTRSGVLAGTPDYMSPEQARGETVTHSSDLFSIGCLLYAMLTGHPPFRAANPMSILNRICNEPARPLHEFSIDIPLELAQVVERLLAKSPKKRFDSAAELAERLRHLASSPRRLKPALGRAHLARLALLAACSLGLVGLLAWRNYPAQTPHDGYPHSLAEVAAEPDAQSTVNSKAATASSQNELSELQRLDESIAQLRSDVQSIANAWRELGQHSSIGRENGFDDIERSVMGLKSEVLRLESEVFPSSGQ